MFNGAEYCVILRDSPLTPKAVRRASTTEAHSRSEPTASRLKASSHMERALREALHV